jgi:uncharacterized membrane protein YcaP (DUF421 family)
MWVPKWSPPEVALRAAIAYAFVVLLFRLAGRRELARYSVFNVIVLFLLSPAMRQTIVGDDTSMTSGMVALSTMVVLDIALSWMSFRSERFADLLTGPVRRLVHHGRVDLETMRRARVSERELLAELRRYGRHRLEGVTEARLERNGRITFTFDEAPREPVERHTSD